MLNSFIAFNQNGISFFLYMITGNFWLFLLIAGMLGTIFLFLKDEVDSSVREEQNIL